MAGFIKTTQAMGPSTAYITQTTSQPTRRPRRGRYTLRTSETQCRATQLVPLYDRLFPGEPVALDTEMLNHVMADETRHKAVGRVSVTNISGEMVLDVYVYYPDDASESQFFDPPRFGVEADDLLSSNGAVPIETAVSWLRKICIGRDVIMHAKYSDLNAFGQYASEIFGRSTVHDTQDFYGVRRLADLALSKLNKTIQADVHSSTEDAQVTGELCVLYTGYDRDAELAKYMWGDQVPGQVQQKASKDRLRCYWCLGEAHPAIGTLAARPIEHDCEQAARPIEHAREQAARPIEHDCTQLRHHDLWSERPGEPNSHSSSAAGSEPDPSPANQGWHEVLGLCCGDQAPEEAAAATSSRSLVRRRFGFEEHRFGREAELRGTRSGRAQSAGWEAG